MVSRESANKAGANGMPGQVYYLEPVWREVNRTKE